VKGRIILFWMGIFFTATIPIGIGLYFENASTAWLAFVCGGFIIFIARLEDLAELSLGPLKAKMRETIQQAHVTIDQLGRVAQTFTKATLTGQMAANFMDGTTLETRLNLHDQLISALKEIGLNEDKIKDADEMWAKGIGIIYHRGIRELLQENHKHDPITGRVSPEILTALEEFQDLLHFKYWQAPTPDQMQEFVQGKGLMTPEIAALISDYRSFVNTGEIKRRDVFVQL